MVITKQISPTLDLWDALDGSHQWSEQQPYCVLPRREKQLFSQNYYTLADSSRIILVVVKDARNKLGRTSRSLQLAQSRTRREEKEPYETAVTLVCKSRAEGRIQSAIAFASERVLQLQKSSMLNRK